ncbi:MAG: LysM peptidoglycan-binding domain-containing protein [Candidatus Rifleibacteriota bacterium]
MWNNLRARHYSVLILLAIVALETSAITIDRLINKEGDTAFAIESTFQNNPFLKGFKVANADSSKNPDKNEAEKLPRDSTPARNSATKTETIISKASAPETKPEKIIKSVKAKFVAASNKTSASKDKAYIEYQVQPGDSLSRIAKLFNSRTDALKNANSLKNEHVVRAGQTIKVPLPSSNMTYTVKRGDSLSKIASRFHIPLKSLIAHNSLKSYKLKADQKLKIPVKTNIEKNLEIVSGSKTQKTENNLKLVKKDNLNLIPNKPKLKKINLNRLQMAKAPATKPKIKFSKKDLMEEPPVVNTAKAKKEKAETSKKASLKTDTKAVKAKGKKEEKKKLPKSLVYKVVKGDNLLKISHKYDTTVAQIKSENNLKSNLLHIGDKLKLSPGKKLYRVVKKSKAKNKKIKIVSHKVRKGECLSIIARRYHSTIGAIADENDLQSTVVKAGQKLKVPANKRKYRIAQKNSYSGKFMKMPVRGRLSSKYGYRKHPVYHKRMFHAGVDIAAPRGTPIAASIGGKVIYAGRRSGYGKMIILRHKHGYSTRYAHCSSLLVRKGQHVRAGQLIARVGATGVATGNHTHFEVRKNGKTVNPLSYVK